MSAPLDGILVADFSRVLAGPLATMTLGDLGADVVKVERPGTGDETRTWGPPFHERGAAYYLWLNRNKRSVALDFGDEGDLALARKLADRADVVIESFRPGVMERFGLDHESVRARNPRAITCSVRAFGEADLPGYDLLLQAMGGLMSITGEPDGPPLRTGSAVVDVVCGLYATVGILAALHARDADGEGRHVQANLMDAALATLVNQAAGWLLAGVRPGKIGNRHPSIAPYGVYEGSDGPFVVAAANDGLWRRLRTALGLAGEDDFATNAQRRERMGALDAILEPIFASRTADEWIAALRDAGVPAGPINDIPAAFAEASRLGLEPTVEIAGLELLRTPVRIEGTSVRLPPPSLDEHGDEIRAWLKA